MEHLLEKSLNPSYYTENKILEAVRGEVDFPAYLFYRWCF